MADEAAYCAPVDHTPPDPVLGRIEDTLSALMQDVAHIRSVLDRAMPVIDAYLSPAASGPVAWAVRQRLRKGGQDA